MRHVFEYRRFYQLAEAVLVAVPWMWLGIAIGISLIETPIRFRTPPITRAGAAMLGVAIFHALASVELVLVVISMLAAVIVRYRLLVALVALVAVIIAAEHAIVVPLLATRAQLLVDGATLPPSSVHGWATALEATKMLLLSVIGVRALHLRSRR
ncbi:MAG: hypothetical protein N2663_03720 [Chlorobi bacterium]|nr:hypothetical protein [Chlorobiota bacterium]